MQGCIRPHLAISTCSSWRRDEYGNNKKHPLKTVILFAALTGLILAAGCLPKPSSESGGSSGVNITLYGFSIMKESLEKAIYPAFVLSARLARLPDSSGCRHSGRIDLCAHGKPDCFH